MGATLVSKKEALQAKAQAAFEKEVLSTGQVATLFGVNFKTALRWAKSGQLPSSRLPGPRGDYRFLKVDVLEFAHKNKLPLTLPHKSPNKSLVLVVDDDPMIASSIARILHGLCNVISATDGYQAGVLMALRNPTLVFLDLQMPKVDGLSLLRYMRAVDELRRTQVCLITGAGQESVNQALNAGASIALMKPFTAEQIRAVAAQMIHIESKKDAA